MTPAGFGLCSTFRITVHGFMGVVHRSAIGRRILKKKYERPGSEKTMRVGTRILRPNGLSFIGGLIQEYAANRGQENTAHRWVMGWGQDLLL